MLLEIIRQIWSKRWVRAVTFSSILVMLGFIIYLVLNRKQFQDFGPFATPFSASDNFSQLQNNAVYSYNGLAFYKLDLGNNQTTILQTTGKLPQPSQIVWAGDQGALINFSGSLYSTRIEQALAERGEKVNEETQLYTWYLDLKTNEFRFVSKFPLQKNLSVYSSQLNGIYYLPDLAAFMDVVPDRFVDLNRFSLNFYDIASGSDKVIAKDLDTVDVVETFLCSERDVCVITIPTQETSKTNVASYSSNGQVSPILDNFNGRIFSTGKPSLVITVPNAISYEVGSDVDEGASAEGPAKLYDIETKEEHELGFTVGNSSVISNFVDKDFYVFDTNQFAIPGEPNRYYITGLLDKKGKPFTKLVDITALDKSESKTGVYLDFASYGSGGKTLLAPITGNLVMFGPIDQTSDISTTSSDEANTLVKKCQIEGNPELQYLSDSQLFRVLIPETPSWQAELDAFGSCLSGNALAAMTGYNYQFMLTDPSTGRIVSD